MYVFLSYFLVSAGIIGSGLAGYFDLKTTEIPDEIPLAMVIIGVLVRFGYSVFTGAWEFFIGPGLIGLLFFGIGMLMYYTGQWGGGDAKILGAMGVLAGVLPKEIIQMSYFPFFIDYFFNIFLVGAIYIVIYAIAISVRNERVKKSFFESMKKSKIEFILFMSFVSIFMLFNAYFFWSAFGVIDLVPALGAIIFGGFFYITWRFLKIVETVGFKKKINTSKLAEGDMLGEDIKKLDLSMKIIRGLTKEEVKKIRNHKKTVWIREGVRFGPVFCISMLVTLLFGNVLMFII